MRATGMGVERQSILDIIAQQNLGTMEFTVEFVTIIHGAQDRSAIDVIIIPAAVVQGIIVALAAVMEVIVMTTGIMIITTIRKLPPARKKLLLRTRSIN